MSVSTPNALPPNPSSIGALKLGYNSYLAVENSYWLGVDPLDHVPYIALASFIPQNFENIDGTLPS